jgi:hypothetical protein
MKKLNITLLCMALSLGLSLMPSNNLLVKITNNTKNLYKLTIVPQTNSQKKQPMFCDIVPNVDGKTSSDLPTNGVTSLQVQVMKALGEEKFVKVCNRIYTLATVKNQLDRIAQQDPSTTELEQMTITLNEESHQKPAFIEFTLLQRKNQK